MNCLLNKKNKKQISGPNTRKASSDKPFLNCTFPLHCCLVLNKHTRLTGQFLVRGHMLQGDRYYYHNYSGPVVWTYDSRMFGIGPLIGALGRGTWCYNGLWFVLIRIRTVFGSLD
jgi:hypothetical protein